MKKDDILKSTYITLNCPIALGLKQYSGKDCDPDNCKKCWEDALEFIDEIEI